MNELTDDILSDLDDLESSTQTLLDQANQAKLAQEKLTASSSAQSIDAASLTLEAAKAAQEAAKQSQQAAESAIKMSNDFKAQVIELADSNTAWRQTARNASHDIERNRNAMIMMMFATVSLGIITASLSAWFLYYNSKKQEIFKGEVLDLIQTENALHNKNITLKVDQISSLIEVLSADIQRLNAAELPKMSNKAIQKSTLIAEQKAPTVEESTASEQEQPAQMEAEKPVAAPQEVTIETTPEIAQPKTQELGTQPPVIFPEHLTLDPAQLAELKTLINLILEKQQKLEASILTQSEMLKSAQKPDQPQQSIAATPKAAEIATAPTVIQQSEKSSLTEKQIKQLDGMGWLIRKQEKTLNEIQETLKNASNTPNGATKSTQTGIEGIEKSLNELKMQIYNLSTQQKAIETQVIELQEQTKKLSEAPKPYSYEKK